jgi:hypothetical protein
MMPTKTCSMSGLPRAMSTMEPPAAHAGQDVGHVVEVLETELEPAVRLAQHLGRQRGGSATGRPA